MVISGANLSVNRYDAIMPTLVMPNIVDQVCILLDLVRALFGEVCGGVKEV